MVAFFRRVADRVARALGRNDARDLGREVRGAARMMGRLSFERPGTFGGAWSGSLGAFRFVWWPRGLGDNPIVHPPSVTLMAGPWRSVRVRTGRYSVFTDLGGGRYGYLRVWRFGSLPQAVRDGWAHDPLIRSWLAQFSMVGRVGPADLPIPQVACADCGETFAYFELEDLDREGRPVCYECHEALLEADAMDHHEFDSGDWDERTSARIDDWGEVYA